LEPGEFPANARTYLSFLSLNSIYQQHVSYQVMVAQSRESAYPGLKSSFSEKELTDSFTPAAEEFEPAHSVTKSVYFADLLRALWSDGVGSLASLQPPSMTK
jgi:hypothetical protein